jgi:hypothetical protein
MNLVAGITKEEPVVYAMAQRLVRRKRAELLWSDEELVAVRREESKLRWHREVGHFFEDGPSWTRNCIYWFKHFRPTEATPFGTSFKRDQKDEEAKEKSIHIQRPGKSKPVPLTECRESFTRHFSNQAYVMVRVYYVGPEGEVESTKQELKAYMSKLKHTGGLRYD